MSDVDVIIRVHTQGVQEIGNLSASLRNLSNSLRGINVPMAKLDTHTKAVYKALGVTSRGVDQHAKSIKGLIQNQRVLGTETKNITRDLNGLRNAYALAGRESTALGRAIGVSTKELSGFSRTFRGMRLRAFGSDLSNISLRLTKLGKDAQFVGRSLMINLTLPLATFARVGLQNFLAMEKQSVRLIKVMENLATTSDMAAQKILGLQNATAADLSGGQIDRANQMVQAYRKMDKALIDLSLRFGVSKDLTTSLAADFAELGLTAEENVQSITQLTLEIEKLGSMDIGPAQDLSQALFFQSKRAFEVTGAMNRLTTARAREKKAIESSITQMYLFNAIENATALTLKDLGDSFAEISAMATSYGLSMTEAAALLAPMKAAGLDIGASANSIKVSLQRLLAPTKQNVDMLQKLAEQFGVASGAQNEFMMSTKTGLVGLQSVVTMFDKVRKSSQGSEGALRLMSDLFEKRQGPRMYLAIEQLADFNNELQKADDNFSNLPSSTVSAELQLVRTADAAAKKFKNFNTTAVPTTIRSFKDIGNVARIATAFAGQVIEFEPGKGTVITAQDIQNAKEMRKAVSETILEAKQSKGIDLISEVKTEAGRALMIQLAGAANASEVANQELARSLQTAGVSVESIRTTFKMFAADIIAYLIPTIQKLAEKVKQMYETWNSPEFAQTRANIIRLITIVGGFLTVLGPIILAIGTFQAVIGKVGLAMTRMIPKLKNADGGLTLLGKSAEFAKKQMNDLYEIFMKTTGVAQAARAGRSGLAPLVPAAGAPALGPARPLIPGSRAGTFLTPRNATDLQALGNVAERTKAIQAARLAKAGLQDITGGPTAAEQQAAFQRYLRSRPTATRLPPAHMAAAMGLPTTTPELQAAFDNFRTLTPAQRSDLTPTSSRRAARRQISAAQRFADRAGIFEAAGVGVTQEMSETGRVGRERFAFRGRDITREQAESIGRGGPRAALTRAQIRGQAIRSGLTARPGVAAFRGAMAAAPSTGAGLASGSVAAIKASTTAMVQNMGSVKGAKAAVAALNAQYALMGGAAPGAMRKLTTATMGAIKGLKIATLAAKVFRMTLMFTGIGAIIAVVASVIFLVVKNLDKIRGSAKVMEPLKAAFNAVKDAVFMVIRPIQDLFAQFGSGADEGEASGNAIVKAFEGIAAAVAFVAGLFKAFVEKVIQPYLYGIVNIVMAVVSMFKGNWGDAFKFLIAGVASIVKGVINLFVGLGTGIVTVLAKAITVVLDLFGKIPLVGGVFRLASKGVNALANTYKSVARGVADFAIKGLDKVVDLGIKKSTNKISSGAKKQEKAATDAGNLAGEAIANAYGDAPIEGANDKIAGKIKEGLADAAQDLYDYVVERFASSIKKFVSESVKALNKQKESALKVFDIQLNTLVKLERAEESLTRKKEYETNRRKLIDDAALRQQNYLRDRALAIYEGRIDDARILDQEERVASRESDTEIATLDEGRRKDLAKENLDALKEAINEAKEVASRFFEESIEKFQEAAEHITRIAPVTQEQYAAQLEELRLKTVEYSDKNNAEFGTMFEKFSTTIMERMPNTVDDFGNALGAFTTPFDELVNLARTKYGLGSEADNTVLGVTKEMSDSVIGITLGMVSGIGDTFSTEAPKVIEEVKTSFIKPFKAALDEAEPTKVFNQAIIDGNQEILNSFKKIVKLNPDLMKQMAASLDPAIAKYIALKAAADAAADAMSNAGGGGGLGDTGGAPFGEDRAEWNRFMRIKEKADAQIAATLKAMGDSYSRGLASSGNFQPIYENRAATFKNRYSTYVSPEQILANANPLSRKEGGPIPIGAALKSTQFGISGFLNAPEQEGIPAILHGGEFVVNAEAVKRIGLGALAKLNDPRIPKFKKGGFVGTADQAERMAMSSKEKSGGILGGIRNAISKTVGAAKSFGKGAYNVATSYGESLNATFINPYINLGGRAIGRNPNLRQAGLVESATNVADVATTVLTGGMSKAAVTAGQAGLKATLSAMAKGSTKTASELIVEKAVQQAVKASAKTAANAGRLTLGQSARIGVGMIADRISGPGIPARIANKTPSIRIPVFGPKALPPSPRIAGELMPGPAQAPTPSMSIPTPIVERISGAIPLPRPIPTSPLPKGDISEYLLHGGPKADELIGGVLNPEFIRGGQIWEILKREGLGKRIGRNDMLSGQQSVLTGSEDLQNQRIIAVYKSAIKIIEDANKYGPNDYVPSYYIDHFGSSALVEGAVGKAKTFIRPGSKNVSAYRWANQVAFAKKFLEENSEIIKRVISGETHMTGVDVAYGTGTSAYQYGGVHLIKVPKPLNPNIGGPSRTAAMVAAPSGERIFWGMHKPIASIDAHWDTARGGIDGYAELIHAMIRDADSRLSPAQLTDFMLSQKIYGNQISPSARSFILEEFDRSSYRFKNAAQLYNLLEMAPTKDAMLDVINTKGIRRIPRGHSREEDRAYTEMVEHLNKIVNEFSLPKQLDPEQARIDKHLNSIIHSGVDGLVLGVVDKVGRITYGEAIMQYRIKQFLEGIPEIHHQTIMDAINGKPINRQAIIGLSNVEDILAKARGLNLDILGGNYATPILPIESVTQQTASAARAVDEIISRIDTTARGAFTPMEGPFGPKFFRSPIDDAGGAYTEMVEKMKTDSYRVFPRPLDRPSPITTPYLEDDAVRRINEQLYTRVIQSRGEVVDPQHLDVINRIISATSENVDTDFFREYILSAIKNKSYIDVQRYYDQPAYLATVFEKFKTNPYGINADDLLEQARAMLTDDKIKQLVLGAKRDIQRNIVTIPGTGSSSAFRLIPDAIPHDNPAASMNLRRFIEGYVPADITADISGGLEELSPLLNIFASETGGYENILKLIKANYRNAARGQVGINLPFNFPSNPYFFGQSLDVVKQHEAIYNALSNVIGITVRDYAGFFDANGLLSPSLLPDTLESKELWQAVKNVVDDMFPDTPTNITDSFLAKLPSVTSDSVAPKHASIGYTDLIESVIRESSVLDVGGFYGYPTTRPYIDSKGMEFFFDILKQKAVSLDRYRMNNLSQSPNYSHIDYLSKFFKLGDPTYFGSGLPIAEGSPMLDQIYSSNIVDTMRRLFDSSMGASTVGYYENLKYLHDIASNYNKNNILPSFLSSMETIPSQWFQIFEIFKEVDARLVAAGMDPDNFLSTASMNMYGLQGIMDLYRPYLASRNIVGTYSGSVSGFAQRFASRRGMPTFPLESNAMSVLEQSFSGSRATQDILNYGPSIATPNDVLLAKTSSFIMTELAEKMGAPLSMLSGDAPISLFRGSDVFSTGAREGFNTPSELLESLAPYSPSLKEFLSRSLIGIDRMRLIRDTSLPRFKKGGFVGGMTSTAIPAMLHGGEYVLNAKAVQQLGLPYLNAMNQVSQSQFRPPSSRVNAPSGNVTNNVSTVNIQVENFIGEEAWFESMMKEYNVNVLPKNQKLAGLEQRKFTSYNGINQGM